MLRKLKVSAVVGLMVLGGNAFAADKNAEKANDMKKCKDMQSDQGQTADVVNKWCECVWEKMPDSAAGSLDSWAKSNKAADEACAAKAGWKG